LLLTKADMADHGDHPVGARIRMETAFAARMGELHLRHGQIRRISLICGRCANNT